MEGVSVSNSGPFIAICLSRAGDCCSATFENGHTHGEFVSIHIA